MQKDELLDINEMKWIECVLIDLLNSIKVQNEGESSISLICRRESENLVSEEEIRTIMIFGSLVVW